MNWKKLGQVYKMEEIHPLLKTHASNPLAIHLAGDVFRVFFSGRDENNKSSVGYVDIDVIKQTTVNTCKEPLIKYGNEESFCSHGISIGNLYRQNEKQFILFMGWNIRGNQHWRGDVGRIELTGTDKMQLNPEKPFMGTDEEDPISLSYPFVVFHEGKYKMWYGSTITWHSENREMIHVIKYATSPDGENWVRHGIAVPYELGVAQAFSRPIVLIEDNKYHMWYSYRSGDGTKYRIGYSVSIDGLNWERKHQDAGIDISATGWDSEMICYPFIFEHKQKKYMLYNGNEFGKTGFGMAVLEN
ncbi:MAG: hypothetical protein ACXVPN_07600 [Bacteroidia bacterium]